MRLKTDSSLAPLLSEKQRLEKQALHDYTAALRNWERLRERADDAAWEFEMAWADMRQKTLAGCGRDEAAALRRACNELQAERRRREKESRQAKEEASARFTALVYARQEREEIEQRLIEAGTFPPIAMTAFALPQLHWN